MEAREGSDEATQVVDYFCWPRFRGTLAPGQRRDIDGASGAILERLDLSRRAYRWLYDALHTMDIPVLVAHPVVRSVLIVLSCGFGLVFSITAILISWRRLGFPFSASRSSRPTP